MRFEFQKATFWIKLKNWLFSNHFLFGSMYFSETWHICLVALFCFQEKILKDFLEYFWRFCISNFERWKNTKIRSHAEAEKLADLFLVFSDRLETWPKRFSYSFIKRCRNEAFRPFLVNFCQTVTMETMTVKKKISTSVLGMYFQVQWLYKVSLSSSDRRKGYQWSKF